MKFALYQFIDDGGNGKIPTRVFILVIVAVGTICRFIRSVRGVGVPGTKEVLIRELSPDSICTCVE